MQYIETENLALIENNKVVNVIDNHNALSTLQKVAREKGDEVIIKKNGAESITVVYLPIEGQPLAVRRTDRDYLKVLEEIVVNSTDINLQLKKLYFAEEE